MARTILDEVLGFRPDFIEHQLAQRAIWLRLLPMRAICRVRSRSMARAGAVHVRVRAIACRSNSDGDTPAAAALSCQAACSAGVTRAATVTVRRSDTGAPATGFGWRRLRPADCLGSGAEGWGF